jgi:hypothetical protein
MGCRVGLRAMEKNALSLPGIDCPARNLATIPTKLPLILIIFSHIPKLYLPFTFF